MCTVLVGCHGSPHPGRPGLTILALGCATHAARATAPPRAQGKAAVRPCGPVEAAELAHALETRRLPAAASTATATATATAIRTLPVPHSRSPHQATATASTARSGSG